MASFTVGMTFKEIQKEFDNADNYIFALTQKRKRTSKALSKDGRRNDELKWCLLIQKILNNQYKTIYKKNLHLEGDDLSNHKVDERMIAIFNKIFA